jgi:hypothetical protein
MLSEFVFKIFEHGLAFRVNINVNVLEFWQCKLRKGKRNEDKKE